MADKKKVGRPLAFKSADELQKKIDKYFIERKKEDKPFTVLSMCIYLDITRETLSQYEKDERYSDTIKKAKAKIEGYAEELLFKGGNPAGIIFNLKNNFGWREKQEVENTNINTTISDLSVEERKARIEELKKKMATG